MIMWLLVGVTGLISFSQMGLGARMLSIKIVESPNPQVGKMDVCDVMSCGSVESQRGYNSASKYITFFATPATEIMEIPPLVASHSQIISVLPNPTRPGPECQEKK